MVGRNRTFDRVVRRNSVFTTDIWHAPERACQSDLRHGSRKFQSPMLAQVLYLSELPVTSVEPRGIQTHHLSRLPKKPSPRKVSDPAGNNLMPVFETFAMKQTSSPPPDIAYAIPLISYRADKPIRQHLSAAQEFVRNVRCIWIRNTNCAAFQRFVMLRDRRNSVFPLPTSGYAPLKQPRGHPCGPGI